MRRQDRPLRAPFAALAMITLAKLMWPGDLRKATLQPVQDEQRVLDAANRRRGLQIASTAPLSTFRTAVVVPWRASS